VLQLLLSTRGSHITEGPHYTGGQQMNYLQLDKCTILKYLPLQRLQDYNKQVQAI